MAIPRLMPPLAWVPSFAKSIERALAQTISYTIEDTVNPLVKNVHLTFSEFVPPKIMGMVWNALEGYAATNQAKAARRIQGPSNKLIASVEIRERLGQPKDAAPWDKRTKGELYAYWRP